MNCNAILATLYSNAKLHSWIAGIVIVSDLFVTALLPKNLDIRFEVIQPMLYTILIIWSIINLFVIIYDRKVINGKWHYFTRIVTVDELIEKPNFNEYAKLFFLLLIGQFSFDFLKISGLIMYLFFAFLISISSLLVIHRDYKRKRTWTTTIIGNLFLLICLLMWSKNTYARINGDETIGSFFEKPEYRAKYYVNLFPETSKSKNYRLVADIHIYSESEEDYEGNSHSYKVISIEKVHFNNGGFLYFDDCQVKFGEKTYCIDQNGKGWDVELTTTKAE